MGRAGQTTTEMALRSFDAMIAGRDARKEALDGLRSGELDAAEAILNPPRGLENVFVWDLLREVRWMGAAKIKELGRAAVDAQVNLAMTLGELPQWRREWLAGRVSRVRTPSGRRHPVLSKAPQG